MFLHLCVILFTGGVGSAPPQGMGRPPPYGQQAGGTRPTGMHTCLLMLKIAIAQEING